MKLLDKWCMSKWAYFQCKSGNDTEEIRSLITSQSWMYMYCFYIKDREEMWTKITSPHLAEDYCINVKDRYELRRLYEHNLIKDTFYNIKYWFKKLKGRFK